MKFLHSMIRVKDIKKSLDFYEKILGLKVVEKMELEDSNLYFLSDGYGDVQLELTENFETPQNGYVNGNAFGHFAFATDSFDDFSKRLKEHGYEYLWEPFWLDGAKSKIAFVKDPDGNEIEIIEK